MPALNTITSTTGALMIQVALLIASLALTAAAQSNNALTSVAFPKLASTNNQITIQYNPQLTSITGFTSTALGDVFIQVRLPVIHSLNLLQLNSGALVVDGFAYATTANSVSFWVSRMLCGAALNSVVPGPFL